MVPNNVTTKMIYIYTCMISPIYYLTIRLRAQDVYEVIVDESEAWISYHPIDIESE